MKEAAVVLDFEKIPATPDALAPLAAPVAGIPLLDRTLLTLGSIGVPSVTIHGQAGLHAAITALLARGADDPRRPLVVLSEVLPDDERFVRMDPRRAVSASWIREARRRTTPAVFVSPDGRATGLDLVTPGEGHRGLVPLVPLWGPGFSVEVLDAAGRRAAEKALSRSLIKPTDGWFSVHLNRPVSLAISSRLARFDVHPNAVTLFTVMVGIAAGVLAAQGTWLCLALGGVLYQAASILDGVDGEIARLKFLGSRSGQWLDTICDDLTNVAWMAGTTIGLFRATGDSAWLTVGLAAAALDVVTIGLLYRCLVTRFEAGTLLDLQWDFQRPEAAVTAGFGARLLKSLEPLVKRDFYALLFMVLAIGNSSRTVIVLSLLGVLGTLGAFVAQSARWRAADTRQTATA